MALFLLLSVLMVSFVAIRWGFNIPNVSAVTTSGNVGVFWDSACTQDVTLTGINWGNVSIGTEKDVVVYVKNLGADPLILSMNSSGWNPTNASQKMFLLWDYGGNPIAAGSVIKLTLRLYVSHDISSVTNFNFIVNLGVGLGKPLDLNGDGKIDISDAALLALSWNSMAGSTKYNYRCDFDDNGKIDIEDVAALAKAWNT